MCHTSSALVVARSDSIDLYNLIGGDRFALAQSWNNLPDEAPVERIPIPVAFVRLDPPSAIVVSGGHDGGLCTRSALGRHEQPVFVGEGTRNSLYLILGAYYISLTQTTRSTT